MFYNAIIWKQWEQFVVPKLPEKRKVKVFGYYNMCVAHIAMYDILIKYIGALCQRK